MGRNYKGAVEGCEEEGVVEENCCGLSAAPVSVPAALHEGSRGLKAKGVELSLEEGLGGTRWLSFYLSSSSSYVIFNWQ